MQPLQEISETKRAQALRLVPNFLGTGIIVPDQGGEAIDESLIFHCPVERTKGRLFYRIQIAIDFMLFILYDSGMSILANIFTTSVTTGCWQFFAATLRYRTSAPMAGALGAFVLCRPIVLMT